MKNLGETLILPQRCVRIINNALSAVGDSSKGGKAEKVG